MTRFNHLNVPETWKHYWSKYPEGYTILEALLNWVNQVDNMVDHVNNWTEFLETFLKQFDDELKKTVEEVLTEWRDNGLLQEVFDAVLAKDVFRKETFGIFEDATALGVIANRGNDARPQVLGVLSSQQLSEYGNRDSVGIYVSNSGRAGMVNHTGGEITYFATSVRVTGATVQDLDKIKPDSVIDTKHSPRFTSLVDYVDMETQTIHVKDGWYMITAGGSQNPSLPANNVGFDINRITKVWSVNSNVFLRTNEPTQSGVNMELGVFNQFGLPTIDYDIGGIDLVNFEKQSKFGFKARPAGSGATIKENFLYGFEDYYSSTSFMARHDDREKFALRSAFNGNTLTDGFELRADGRQSKLKLRATVYTNGNTNVGSLDNKILLINKTVKEDFFLPTPSSERVGEVMYAVNAGTEEIDFKLSAGNIIVNEISASGASLLPKSSCTFVCDGSNWFAVGGSWRQRNINHYILAAGAPTQSAKFVGQIYIESGATPNIWMARTASLGAADWQKIT